MSPTETITEIRTCPPTTPKGALVGVAACLAMLLSTRPAAAQEFRLHIEPAASFWVDQPQTEHFAPGFYFAVRPALALGPVLSLQWSYSLLLTPSGEGYSEVGSAHSLTAGLRLRPFGGRMSESDQLGGLFIDGDLGYVRSGELSRFGFDAGLGYEFQLTPGFSLGPVLRYGQIVQPDDIPSRDPNDAQYLNIGLSFGFARAYQEPPPPVTAAPLVCPEADAPPACPATPECPTAPECPTVVETCADRDRDGVCDINDRCPTQSGPESTFGCPIDPCNGPPLVVLVQFGYDSARMPVLTTGGAQTMDPVLDAVAAAIAQDPSCRVCIVGYASEEGSSDYNLDLSRQRASAVEDYMSAHGLAQRRMPTTGMGEACQLVPEDSREMNRRVEFRRLQEGQSCPLDCSK